MNFFDESTLKKILYTFLAVLIVATLIAVSFYIWYGNKLQNLSEEYSLETREFEIDDMTKEASSTEDKNIDASKNIISNISTNNTNNTNTIAKSETNNSKSETSNVETDNKTLTNASSVEKENTEKTVANESKEENKTVTKKELDFDAPIDGEIIKDFANETLVYSKTLEEWTTHLGIDIKGAKTSIVKSAEDGVVESIKNDPRYGLTVTISHEDGFKTVYSNLLTTEFVQEGDKVDKGDTIATIGETASFEVLDETHLHFEMYKDEQPVNPTLYLK